MAKGQTASDQPGGLVEGAMEQARRAADTYCDFVKQAIAATRSGGNEFAERIKGYAEKNISMTQEYLRQLSQARTFQDMVRIQADFMQSLMKAFGEQILGEAYKAAADMGTKPISGRRRADLAKTSTLRVEVKCSARARQEATPIRDLPLNATSCSLLPAFALRHVKES